MTPTHSARCTVRTSSRASPASSRFAPRATTRPSPRPSQTAGQDSGTGRGFPATAGSLWSERIMRTSRANTAMGKAIALLLAMTACRESEKDTQAALYRFAGADQCDLLRAADPAALLGVEIDPEPLRVYGVCRLHGKQGQPAEWPTTDLEMRKDPENGVPKDLDEFWDREGAGVERRGARREQVEELSGIGDYALWYSFRDGHGMQL